MDFELSEDDEALQEGVRRLCQGVFPMDKVRALEAAGGVDGGRWRELTEAGVFSLRRPEAEGGAGLGMVHAALVFEQLGLALVPGPLVATHLAAGVVDGEVVGTVERGDHGALVEHLDALDALVVVDDEGLWRVDATELDGRPVPAPLDPLTPVHEVDELPPGEQVGGPDDALRWRREGRTLTAALQVGMADAVLRLATEHAKARRQFGRAIGSFQAVKHTLADMLVRTEVARAAVYAAGCTMDDPSTGDPERAVAGAKLLAGQAAVENAKACIQVHGGMGFSWEVDAHLYLKRAWVLDAAFGSTDAEAEAVAATL